MQVKNSLFLRERCLAFISCLDELEQVSSQDQIFLFKRNLDNVEMLAYVFWFNRGAVDAETKFIFGSGDMEEWQVRRHPGCWSKGTPPLAKVG